jgi:hypothetical protein
MLGALIQSGDVLRFVKKLYVSEGGPSDPERERLLAQVLYTILRDSLQGFTTWVNISERSIGLLFKNQTQMSKLLLPSTSLYVNYLTNNLLKITDLTIIPNTQNGDHHSWL